MTSKNLQNTQTR